MRKILSVVLSISILISGMSASAVCFADEEPQKNVTKKWRFMDALGWTSILGDNLKKTIEGFSYVTGCYSLAKKIGKVVNLKKSQISSNIDSVMDELNKELENIKGQDAAKKKMKEIVSSILDARNEAIENKKPYGKGDVIYMVGPSGVGKTFSADCLARAIMGKKAKPIYVDASDIDRGSHSSIKEQLFCMREGQKRNSLNNVFANNVFANNVFGDSASLVRQIETNPNVVLIINEYDKMHTPDFDEVLRTIIDRGQISIYNEKVDCSGLLVIVTSNEDHWSVTAGNNVDKFEDDGTGSRTRVNHDKSLLNRLNIVEFENLDKDAYKLIAESKLKKVAERYKKKYSVNLNFVDTAEKIADKTLTTNQGAREIEKILAGLKSAIIKTRVNKRDQNMQFDNVTYNVYYDNEKNEFRLEDVATKDNLKLETSENENDNTIKLDIPVETKIDDPKIEIPNLDDQKVKLDTPVEFKIDTPKIEVPNIDDYKVKLDTPTEVYSYDAEKDEYVLENNESNQENMNKVLENIQAVG